MVGTGGPQSWRWLGTGRIREGGPLTGLTRPSASSHGCGFAHRSGEHRCTERAVEETPPPSPGVNRPPDTKPSPTKGASGIKMLRIHYFAKRPHRNGAVV